MPNVQTVENMLSLFKGSVHQNCYFSFFADATKVNHHSVYDNVHTCTPIVRVFLTFPADFFLHLILDNATWGAYKSG